MTLRLLGIFLAASALIAVVPHGAFAQSSDEPTVLIREETYRAEFPSGNEKFRVQVPYAVYGEERVPMLGEGIAPDVKEYELSPSRRYVYLSNGMVAEDAAVTPYVYDLKTRTLNRVCGHTPDCNGYTGFSYGDLVQASWLPGDMLAIEYDNFYDASTTTPATYVSISSSTPWNIKEGSVFDVLPPGQPYRSNIENMETVLPEGWSATSTDNARLPRGYRDPTLVFTKHGSSCVIATAHDSYSLTTNQVSFGDRVKSRFWQSDSSWFTNTNDEFSFLGRQYIPGEFRVANNIRTNPVVLYTKDRTPVPDDCNADLNSFLYRMVPYYESIELKEGSSGTLTSEQVWNDFGTQEDDGSFEHLVFTPTGAREHYEVSRLPEGVSLDTISVHAGKLYFHSNVDTDTSEEDAPYFEGPFDSALYELDPFTKELVMIPGSDESDTYISSLYIHDDLAYFLRGGSDFAECLYGYGDCPTDLYTLPLVGGTPQRLYHSDSAEQILGYAERTNTLYLYSGGGDAGCYSEQLEVIRKGKRLETLESHECGGYTEEEEAERPDERKLHSLVNLAEALQKSAPAVAVKRGKLGPASPDPSFWSMFVFDKP